MSLGSLKFRLSFAFLFFFFYASRTLSRGFTLSATERRSKIDKSVEAASALLYVAKDSNNDLRRFISEIILNNFVAFRFPIQG